MRSARAIAPPIAPIPPDRHRIYRRACSRYGGAFFNLGPGAFEHSDRCFNHIFNMVMWAHRLNCWNTIDRLVRSLPDAYRLAYGPFPRA